MGVLVLHGYTLPPVWSVLVVDVCSCVQWRMTELLPVCSASVCTVAWVTVQFRDFFCTVGHATVQSGVTAQLRPTLARSQGQHWQPIRDPLRKFHNEITRAMHAGQERSVWRGRLSQCWEWPALHLAYLYIGLWARWRAVPSERGRGSGVNVKTYELSPVSIAHAHIHRTPRP